MILKNHPFKIKHGGENEKQINEKYKNRKSNKFYE